MIGPMPKWGNPEFKAWWLAYLGQPEDAERQWQAKVDLMEGRNQVRPLTIIGDIEPYRAVANDVATGRPPEIMGRAQHREFLKRNNYQEVGNEMPKPRSEQPVNTREIGSQIKQIIDQKGLRL